MCQATLRSCSTLGCALLVVWQYVQISWCARNRPLAVHVDRVMVQVVAIMPNRQQLEAWGRQDLAAAIQRHGGFKHFAAQLDLTFQPSQRQSKVQAKPQQAAPASPSAELMPCG